MQGRIVLLTSSVVLLLTLAIGLDVTARVGAAPAAIGELDPTFGQDGRVFTDFPVAAGGEARQVAAQPDHKIVLAVSAGADFNVLRLLPDGSVDTSFGDGGHVLTDFNNKTDLATALVLQPDGKIVVGGSTNTPTSDSYDSTSFALARYNTNGSLDTSFGVAGKIITSISATSAVSRLALQADGKIVAVGSAAQQGANRQIALARYNGNGSLDASFDSDGTLVMAFGTSGTTGPQDIALMPDNSIIIVGTYAYPVDSSTDYALTVFKLKSSGAVDTAFGVNGQVVTKLDVRSLATTVALQSDGKIVVGGAADAFSSGGHFLVARYLANGDLDSSFGDNGVVRTKVGQVSGVANVIIQPDGKIVAAGSGEANGTIVFALQRLDSSGQPDGSFGANGVVVTPFGSGDDQSTALTVALQSDGMLVAAGLYSPRFGNGAVPVSRYTTSGQLDSGFHGEGKLLTPGFIAQENNATSIVAQPDGKLVVAGYATLINGQSVFALARYNHAGSPDPGFGANGKLTTVFATYANATAVALQPDGKIIVAGYLGGFGPGTFALARYNSDGSLDTGFGANGVSTLSFGADDKPYGLALQADGKIVLAGTTATNSSSDFALARFNTDGSLDTGFGVSGRVVTDIAGKRDAAQSVVIQPDGMILVAGYSYASGPTAPFNFALARYTSQGQLDTGFGHQGTVTTNVAHLNSRATAVRVQADGRIIAAGYTSSANGEPQDFAAVRYSAAGVIDTSFDGDGKAVIDFALRPDQATAMELQRDGKIVIGGLVGEVCLGCGADRFGLARLQPDGSLDSSFGRGGKVFTDMLGYPLREPGLALQGDGKIVLAGGSHTDFALARYSVSALPEPTNTPTITPIPPTPATGPGCLYSDVCPSDYFFGPVKDLAQRGAVSGYGNNTFRPYNNATRGQLAKIVVLAENLPITLPSAPTFRDVLPDNPFYGFVETAAAKGIISGYDVTGGKEFRPNNEITRGQLSKIVVVAAGWSLVSPAQPTFSDVLANNPFYGFVETAVQHGIISGYGDTFRPFNNATRGQIAKIVDIAITSASKRQK